jgi:hypothetical protein
MPGGPGADRRSGASGGVAWTCLGRERHPTRAPTRPKAPGPKGAQSYGFGWVALGRLASSGGLITQRSLVQIQPPQPLTARG